MNPALPGGALGAETTIDEERWSAGARIGYAFVPYGRLQQGRTRAANPNQLAIDVHLGTLQLQAGAPTGTSLDLQLPVGSLITTTINDSRTDSGAGDLEIRIQQALGRLVGTGPVSIGISLGFVAPTGGYVARSGAANLAPEASYLTLGRGVGWWLADAEARLPLGSGAALFAQVSGRGPLSRTRDDFAWGSEVRATLAFQRTITGWLGVLTSSDLQWRDGASEPDPFAGGRLPSANAGGWQWAISPAVVITLRGGLALVAGARIPIVNDVVGNQLVPQLGGFASLSFARPFAGPRAPPPPTPADRFKPSPGRITVVDYWATWCAPCAEISDALSAAAPRWPDVHIIKIDATDWPDEGAPVLPKGASGLPVVEVFDRTGTSRAILVGPDALRVVDEVDSLRSRPSLEKDPP